MYHLQEPDKAILFHKNNTPIPDTDGHEFTTKINTNLQFREVIK